jgi:hypothetical protein
MSVKPAHPKVDEGPITRGKGLDTLDRFIIQNWAPPTRFGVWRDQVGVLSPPKVSLERFFNETLKTGWMRDGAGAVITIDPPLDPFVTIRVESENKHWTPEAKYTPNRWLWKVVPVASALFSLEAALKMPLPDPEGSYLRDLREGTLKEAWDAFLAARG